MTRESYSNFCHYTHYTRYINYNKKLIATKKLTKSNGKNIHTAHTLHNMREANRSILHSTMPTTSSSSSHHVMFSSSAPVIIDIPLLRTSMVDLFFYTQDEICKMKVESDLEEAGTSLETLTSSGKDMFQFQIRDEEQVTTSTTDAELDSRRVRVREQRPPEDSSSRDRGSRTPIRSGSRRQLSPPRRANNAVRNVGSTAVLSPGKSR